MEKVVVNSETCVSGPKTPALGSEATVSGPKAAVFRIPGIYPCVRSIPVKFKKSFYIFFSLELELKFHGIEVGMT